MIAYKLFKERKDGSIGPLYINSTQRVPFRTWVKARTHPTKGFAVRPGWHCVSEPYAPHLSKVGRVWCEVEITGVTEIKRPEAQGGKWYLGKKMRVLRKLNVDEI